MNDDALGLSIACLNANGQCVLEAVRYRQQDVILKHQLVPVYCGLVSDCHHVQPQPWSWHQGFTAWVARDTYHYLGVLELNA
jgi:hypothetical protein